MNHADCRFDYLPKAIVIFALFAAGLGDAYADGVYKWVDQDGVTHYSDTQPSDANAELVQDNPVNVIPSDAAPDTSTEPAPQATDSPDAAEQAAAALAARRSQMIQDCEGNNGIDCAQQVDTELAAEALDITHRVNRNGGRQ